MRLAVGRTAPHDLAEPVDGCWRVLVEPVGVTEVEEVVGRIGGHFRGSREVPGGLAGLLGDTPRRAWITPRLLYTAAVGRLVEQGLVGGERFVPSFQVDQRQAGGKTRPPAEARRRGYRLRCREGSRMLLLVRADLPDGEVRTRISGAALTACSRNRNCVAGVSATSPLTNASNTSSDGGGSWPATGVAGGAPAMAAPRDPRGPRRRRAGPARGSRDCPDPPRPGRHGPKRSGFRPPGSPSRSPTRARPSRRQRAAAWHATSRDRRAIPTHRTPRRDPSRHRRPSQ